MTDRELVEWVSRAEIGERLPAEYEHDPRRLIRRLVEIGVMSEPAQGSAMIAVFDEAQRSARAWLERAA